MSDANEKEWNTVGRASGPAGMTKGASLQSGLSAHSQHDGGAIPHGQGQRPAGAPESTVTHRGKKFRHK